MALRSRGSYNVEIKLEGNWFKFNDIVNSTNILLIMAARQGQREFAESYRDKVKENILTGGKRFGYPQNSPKYLYLKLKAGGPSTPLVWSRAYYESVEVISNTSGSKFMVGIPKDVTRGDYGVRWDRNKLSIAEYANVIEHGTIHIPPRPIFSDTFTQQMGGKAGLKRAIEMAIIRKYGSKGIKLTR